MNPHLLRQQQISNYKSAPVTLEAQLLPVDCGERLGPELHWRLTPSEDAPELLGYRAFTI